MYLIDTDWIVDYLKGKKNAVDKLQRACELEINVAGILRIELRLCGLNSSLLL